MNEIVQFVIDRGPWVAIAALVLWFLIKGVAEHYAQKKIDESSEKSLEDYRYKLSSAADAARHEYEKQLRGYGIFVQRKHECYADVYSNLRVADGSIRGLTGVMEVPDFARMTDDGIRSYFEARHVTRDFLNESLRGTAANTPERTRAASRLFHHVRHVEARKAVDKANNSFLTAEIYFSSELSELIRPIVRDMHESLILVEERMEGPIPQDDRIRMGNRAIQLRDQIPNRLEEILRRMRQELGSSLEPETLSTQNTPRGQ